MIIIIIILALIIFIAIKFAHFLEYLSILAKWFISIGLLERER